MSPALIQASQEVEDRLGGRETIAVTILTAPLTPEEDEKLTPFAEALVDPGYHTRPLHCLAHDAGTTLSAVLHAYERILLRRAQFLSTTKIAAALPTVAQDALELARIRENTCRRCKGSGKVRKAGRPKKGEEGPLEVDCPACDGVGSVVAEPSDKQSRIGLELGGLLDKSTPLVAINQNAVNIGPAASGSLVDVQRAVHAILSRRELPPAPSSPDAPVEGVVIPEGPQQP
jgi:hypothetical protein